MITTISKKTIQQQAKLLQKNSTLNYSQSLHQVARNLGFKNYDHHKMMKQFQIAVYSQKGGVGKTPISRNLAIDLNSDKYIRTDYRVARDEKNFIQLFPTIKEYESGIPKTNLSVVYDLCTYTKFDLINNIISDIDLFIIPTKAHECNKPWSKVIIKSIKKVYTYNKPILVLSHGDYKSNKEEDLSDLYHLKSELKEYKDIYYIYLPYSRIYSDDYVYPKDFRASFLFSKNKFDLDTEAKSLLEIYNTSKTTKHLFRNIHKEYLALLALINDLLTKDK